MIYRISHISDLMQIPPEHWDECMSDLHGVIVSLHLVQAATPLGHTFDASKMLTHIDFTPDGLGNITPTMKDGTALFTMKVTRDAQAKETKRVRFKKPSCPDCGQRKSEDLRWSNGRDKGKFYICKNCKCEFLPNGDRRVKKKTE